MIALPYVAPYGLEAIMWLIWAQKMIGWVLGALAVQRVVGFSIKQQVFAGASALLASIIMAGAVILTSARIPEHVDDIAKLLLLVVLGALTYPLVLLIVSPRTTLRRIRALVLLFAGKKERALQTMMNSPDNDESSNFAPEVSDAAKS